MKIEMKNNEGEVTTIVMMIMTLMLIERRK